VLSCSPPAVAPVLRQELAATLEAGGIDELANGTAYTLVIVGPSPGFEKRRWWNDPLVTIVRHR
jgi:hypothetical protein